MDIDCLKEKLFMKFHYFNHFEHDTRSDSTLEPPELLVEMNQFIISLLEIPYFQKY